MSSVPNTFLTPEEYLKLERAAEFKSEYYGGQTFVMVGASYAHVRIVSNLIVELGNRLKGGPCQALSSDLRVKVERSGLYTYPDIAIVCGEPRFEDQQFDTLLNPKVIVEVLSPSTEGYDRGKKFDLYAGIESLTEYVLIAQDKPFITRHVRHPERNWMTRFFSDPNESFELETVPATIPFGDIYAGVPFPQSGVR